MTVELPVAATIHGRSLHPKLFWIKSMRLLEPDKNWCKLTLDDGKEFLVGMSYEEAKNKIQKAKP